MKRQFCSYEREFARIQDLVHAPVPLLTFDEEGKPENIKEVIDDLRARRSKLFTNNPGAINAGEGRKEPVTAANMNQLIRQSAAGPQEQKELACRDVPRTFAGNRRVSSLTCGANKFS